MSSFFITCPPSCPLLPTLFTYISAPSCVLTFNCCSSLMGWLCVNTKRIFNIDSLWRCCFFFQKATSRPFSPFGSSARVSDKLCSEWWKKKAQDMKAGPYGFIETSCGFLWFSSLGEALHDVLLVLCRLAHHLEKGKTGHGCQHMRPCLLNNEAHHTRFTTWTGIRILTSVFSLSSTCVSCVSDDAPKQQVQFDCRCTKWVIKGLLNRNRFCSVKQIEQYIIAGVITTKTFTTSIHFLLISVVTPYKTMTAWLVIYNQLTFSCRLYCVNLCMLWYYMDLYTHFLFFSCAMRC